MTPRQLYKAAAIAGLSSAGAFPLPVVPEDLSQLVQEAAEIADLAVAEDERNRPDRLPLGVQT